MLRLLRAYVDSVHYGITQKKFAVGVLGKYLKSQDVPFLEAVQEMYLGRYIPKIPYPSVEAMKRALDDIAERDPRARGAKAEQFIDVDSVSGFGKGRLHQTVVALRRSDHLIFTSSRRICSLLARLL